MLRRQSVASVTAAASTHPEHAKERQHEEGRNRAADIGGDAAGSDHDRRQEVCTHAENDQDECSGNRRIPGTRVHSLFPMHQRGSQSGARVAVAGYMVDKRVLGKKQPS